MRPDESGAKGRWRNFRLRSAESELVHARLLSGWLLNPLFSFPGWRLYPRQASASVLLLLNRAWTPGNLRSLVLFRPEAVLIPKYKKLATVDSEVYHLEPESLARRFLPHLPLQNGGDRVVADIADQKES